MAHAAVAVAVMLLGSLTFIMSIFYLINWEDRDIQRYSWAAVSSTISIFCAVLLFQSIDGVVNLLVGAEELSALQFTTDAAQMIAWFLLLQIVLGTCHPPPP